jgi:hypothetical protein
MLRAIANRLNAARVWFTPSGTGATARTVQARLRDWVSVKDFGATGDGSTDDVTKIQAAEDALATNGGGTLWFPAGTYIISAPLKKKKGTHWLGAGFINPSDTNGGAIIKLQANADCKMLQTPAAVSGSANDAVHYMGLENLVFDGNRDNQTRSTEYTAVEWLGTHFPGVLRNVFIRQVWGPGLDTGVYGSDGLILDGVWINLCATDNYAWRHNNGVSSNAGLLYLNNVFVENTSKATGYSAGEGATELRSTPTRRGKGILLQRAVKVVTNALHVESAQPCITVDGGELIDLGMLDVAYYGDDTNADVISILNNEPYQLSYRAVRTTDGSSGTKKIVNGGAFTSEFPDVNNTANYSLGYRAGDESGSRIQPGYEAIGGTKRYGKKSNNRTSVSTNHTVQEDDYWIEVTSGTGITITLPSSASTLTTTNEGRELLIANRLAENVTITAGSEVIYPKSTTSIKLPPKSIARLILNSGGAWYMERLETQRSVNVTAVGNVGTGEDNLMTYSLIANTLSADQRVVRITAWGTTANNSNTKEVKLYFGATAILTTALTVSQAGRWRINAEVCLVGSSSQDYSAQLIQGGTTTLVDVEGGSLTETDTAAITIKCTGTVTDGGGGVNNNDITQEGMIVEIEN